MQTRRLIFSVLLKILQTPHLSQAGTAAGIVGGGLFIACLLGGLLALALNRSALSEPGASNTGKEDIVPSAPSSLDA